MLVERSKQHIGQIGERQRGAMKHLLNGVIRDQDYVVGREVLSYYRGLGLDGFLDFWQTCVLSDFQLFERGKNILCDFTDCFNSSFIAGQ